ncbi:MAG: hypothetical protein ACKO3W_09290 [bacterium]
MRYSALHITRLFTKRRTVGCLFVALTYALLASSGAARAETGGAPPPPGLSVEPEAPLVSRRIILQYQLFIYPAYRTWLVSSNGQVDSLAAFALFLSTLQLTPYERACYMECYVLYRRS